MIAMPAANELLATTFTCMHQLYGQACGTIGPERAYTRAIKRVIRANATEEDV